MIKQDLDFC